MTRGGSFGSPFEAASYRTAAVRELVAELVSEGVEATVPATVRETVEKLRELYAAESKAVTIVKLAEELKLDKSAAWRRVRAAIDQGYAKNLKDRRGRPAQLVPGDDLPDDIEILPTPERLQGCTVAGDSEGIKEDVFSEAPEEGGDKKVASTPPTNTATVQPSEENEEGTDGEHSWDCLCEECVAP